MKTTLLATLVTDKLEWTYHVNKRMGDYKQSHLQKHALLISTVTTTDV